MYKIISKLEEINFKNIRISPTIKRDDSEKISPEDCKQLVYEKSTNCPVCKNNFNYWALMKTKLKLVSTDMDLKPNYNPIDPLYYDVLICPHCGYGAMSKYFSQINDKKIDIIKNSISSQYILDSYPIIYTPEIAIHRYLIALFSTVLKEANDSERAYLCLKLSWLNRDKKDNGQELLFQGYALVWLKSALENEESPICGMDEPTVMYILAELSRRFGNFDEAVHYISKVLATRDIPKRLYDRAIMSKEMTRRDKLKEVSYEPFKKVVANVFG